MPSSTRKLLIAFGILLLVTLVYSTFEKRRTTSRITPFARVDVEEIMRIEVKAQGEEEVAMERQGDRWVIVSPITYPANQSNVESLLEKVADLSVTNLVSSNPANHDLYEVGNDTGTLVRLLGGRNKDRRLLTFYVGKVTSDISGTYVREFGVDDVYAASGLLRGYFNKTLSAWRDRTIFKIPQTQVTAVAVAGKEYTFTLSRRGAVPGGPDAAWILQAGSGPVAADSTQAARVIRTAANLTASDFPPSGKEIDADWENPAVRIDLTLSGGEHAGLSAVPIPDDSSRYWVKKDGEETIFIIYRSTLDSVVRDPSTLEQGAGG